MMSPLLPLAEEGTGDEDTAAHEDTSSMMPVFNVYSLLPKKRSPHLI